MRQQLLAVVLAALLVLAGCSGATNTGGDTEPDTVGDTPTQPMGSGTVNFYVSDERNAIGDFEHLDVTITAVSFHAADGGDDTEESASEADADTENETETPETEGTESPETDVEADSENETETETPEVAADTEDESEDDSENRTETPEPEREAEDEQEEGDWVVREVNETTVDLTELQGENATMLSRMALPNGTYDQVRIHVSDVNGTLTGGEQVNVKLPSERLKLNSEFTVGDGEEVDFVYDATVFEAGKSGKYILKPVASESGTDVPIRSVDEDGEDDEREDEGGDDLDARFAGAVEPGENATVEVTRQGEAVPGATVAVGDREYETGEDGTVTFPVPSDAEDLEVEVEHEDGETELTRTFGGEPEDPGNSSSAAERDE